MQNASHTMNLTLRWLYQCAQKQVESSQLQALLVAKDVELLTLSTSNDALVERCDMLDGIARASQEKLKRERAEHSHYEDVLQRQLRASIDKNASLVAVLTQQNAAWEQKIQQQQNDEESYKDNYYSIAPAASEGAGVSEYYHSCDDALGDDISMLERYPSHYSADETGTLTPTEEKQGDVYYSSEHDGSTNAGHSDRHGNNSPSISPSRVGAVWNKFFENVAVATERTRSSSDDDNVQPQVSRSIVPSIQSKQQRQQLQPQLENPSAMFMAIRKSELAQLQKLLLRGISPNARDVGEKGTPLHLAYVARDHFALHRTLLCSG